MITKVVNVDLHQPIYEKLTAKQGDIASRFILFHLLDGDAPFDLTGKSVRVYARKPDKTEIFNNLIINDETKGYCTLELTSQCLSEAGIVKMELYISESGKVLTSIPFDLKVISCINSADSIISTNEFSALEAALGSLQDYNNLKGEVIQARKAYANIGARLNDFDSQLDNKADEVDLKILENRMDNFTSLPEQSVTSVGDAELIGGRVGFLGESYNNIGDSIRQQSNLIATNGLLNYKTVDLSNVINGYISSGGSLYFDSAYRTDVINLEKDETILIYANGYLTNVSIISMKKDNAYTPLVVCPDSNFRWYQYTANENMSIILSFMDKDECRAVIIKKTDTLEKNKMDKLLFDVETKTIGFIDDCYITNDGSKSLNTSSGHVMSDPIHLNKGDVIYVKCDGVIDIVSIISKVDVDNYIPIIIANGSGEYKHEAIEDMEVVISAHKSWDKTYTVFNKFNAKQNNELNEKFNDITSNLLDVKRKVVNTYTNDCYITNDGLKCVDTNSYHIMSEEITLNKGDIIYVECDVVIDVVSIISRVNNNGYTPLVIADETKKYRYEATEDMKVVISAYRSWDKTYTVFSKSYAINGIINDFTPSFSMFEKFGVIGDSYSSGEVAINGYIDYYNLSWGQILARMSGNKCINFSSGGLSTRTWLTHEKGLQLLKSSEPQQLYICALGINDGYHLGESYLGTIADIQTKADTFYGNYAKIIEAVKTKAPNAKIIILTIAGYGTTTSKFNKAITDISIHYNIPCIVQNDDAFFNSTFYTNYMANGHPVAIVYSAMAKTFRRLVEKCMFDNFIYFRDYIG